MKKSEKKILKQAYRIIYREYGSGARGKCKEYQFTCFLCQANRFLTDFYSLLTFYLEINLSQKEKKNKRYKLERKNN